VGDGETAGVGVTETAGVTVTVDVEVVGSDSPEHPTSPKASPTTISAPALPHLITRAL
jgi:hypothetical protein